MEKRRVVVTGLGIVSALGSNIDSFRESCLAGVSPLAPLPEAWRANHPGAASQSWSPLPEYSLETTPLDRIEMRQLDPVSIQAMAAAAEALARAGIHPELADRKANRYRLPGIDSTRCGISLGTGIGGIHTIADVHAFQLLDRHRPAPEDSSRLPVPARFHPYAVSMLMPNAAAANLSIKFGIHGPADTVALACASGTAAVGRAATAIARGEADCMLAGGSEYLFDPYGTVFRSFDAIRALAHGGEHPDAPNRPFDRGRSGFLFSQGGAALLVLEGLEHALARGATPLAEILACAETSDATNIMMPDPTGAGIERMARRLLANGGLAPQDIDYLNTHGTGTAHNDDAETALITRLFGPHPVLLNSTKSLLGHTIGASGAIEALVTVLALHDGRVHPCANLADPIAELQFVREPGGRAATLRHAVSWSFAFGGHNAGLLFGAWHG
jgi:3-oxoacyl-[acyl-carrier-protein] synthase II